MQENNTESRERKELLLCLHHTKTSHVKGYWLFGVASLLILVQTLTSKEAILNCLAFNKY